MWDFAGQSFVVVMLALLVIVNAGCVVMVALQLPGTWVMLALTAAAAWWRWDQQTIGQNVLIAMGALAILGEVIETASSSAAAGKAGGSKRGMLGALAGAVVGAIAGSLLIPIPIAGTILGACLGAGGGSILGDLWAGRRMAQAWGAGRAAAVGRFWGTVGKLAVAVTMWLLSSVAIAWP